MAIRAHRIRSFIAGVVALVLGVAVIGFLLAALGMNIPFFSNFVGQ